MGLYVFEFKWQKKQKKAKVLYTFISVLSQDIYEDGLCTLCYAIAPFRPIILFSFSIVDDGFN